ncbi:MAG: hypothetical protein IJS88_01385 [Alphaproteobacteria bacterium]|nr:hypothetical protein [Alphaproteobacteria bacterium]
MKKLLTVDDVRKAIDELGDPELSCEVADMSDEDLLGKSFEHDFMLDSLEIVTVTMNLECDHHLSVPDDVFTSFKLSGGTVKALLDEYNKAIA